MSGLSVNNLSKNYGDVRALNHVCIEFQENKIYGLLGRNGAGKSTLLNVITGRVFAEQGDVLLNGEKVVENDRALQRIFMMSEKDYYPEGMKVSAAFRWTKEFYPNFDETKAMKLVQQFGLNTGKKIKSLSTGYRSIFKLITALCVRVPYVLLDEPVLGLDANHRDLFYKILIEIYAENPATYIISTHLIEEVSGLIEDIIIIKEGNIIRNEPKEELLSNYYSVSGTGSAIDNYAADKKVIGMETLGGLKTACIEGVPDENGVFENIEFAKMDLQRLFIQLTKS